MRKFLLLLLPVTLLLASCDNYGKKVEIGKNEVYYKGDGVTEADAKKLGDYLQKEKYFNDSATKSVQLLKEGSAYVVKLVVDKDKLNVKDEETMNQYWIMQALFSENVFNGTQTKVVLADTKLKDIQAMEPIRKINSGNFQLYIRGNDVTEEQAKKIASLLEEKKYFGNAQEAIMMEKKGANYVLNFVYNKDYFDQYKNDALPIFKMIQWLMSEEVFNNKPTEVNLTNGLFVPYEHAGEFTAQEKTSILQQSQQTDESSNQVEDNGGQQQQAPVNNDDDQE